MLWGGHGRIWGTAAGALILGLISNILNLTNFESSHLNGTFQGTIIVIQSSRGASGTQRDRQNQPKRKCS